ncbi:hypothetical protein I4641_15540 [Waterburya agarophytonicola K14]|uniref:Uncharacterized protein n=1 Tax=Waterburya agarophytonicola KI4 TaxID=2874699 RepID=A0A964FGU7_9CYAN|nr:hypothetical protein [Waterburya agarophytonicola]MCC0178392.1 hypothetical protein [Waterburya agarophytonicola KI4]
MTKSKPQAVRFKLYHQLDATYHQLLDELSQTDLTDGEIGKIAQILMLSRQESLKRLVSEPEMAAYYKAYPQDQ